MRGWRYRVPRGQSAPEYLGIDGAASRQRLAISYLADGGDNAKQIRQATQVHGRGRA